MEMNEERIQRLIISWSLRHREVVSGLTLGMIHELSKDIMEKGDIPIPSWKEEYYETAEVIEELKVLMSKSKFLRDYNEIFSQVL